MTITGTLRYGTRSAAVIALQKQLKATGHFSGPITGYYGPLTRASVSSFERAKGLHRDGVADPVMRTKLNAAAAAKTKAARPAATGPASWKNAPAPKADYRRVRYHGVTMNVRTREMLQRAERYSKALGGPASFSLSQGSYHPGVGLSAGTHDGGGVLDVRINSVPRATADKIVKALRMAGFAGWRRGVNDGLPPHIHAVAIGDRQASRAAKSQVAEYFRGGDGLRGNRRDIHLTSVGHRIGRPVPSWATRYG
jgi:peptidoglycan hydrolase-like protein with peptidoglycan-binding domain